MMRRTSHKARTKGERSASNYRRKMQNDQKEPEKRKQNICLHVPPVKPSSLSNFHLNRNKTFNEAARKNEEIERGGGLQCG